MPRFFVDPAGITLTMLWLAILTACAAAAALVCLVYALTSAHD